MVRVLKTQTVQSIGYILFHPKGDVSFPSKTSAQSVGSDDFSVFSDGSETSTDSFASGESVGSVEPVISDESQEVDDTIEIEDSEESSDLEIINEK